MTDAPTIQELRDHVFEEDDTILCRVDNKTKAGWRHGCDFVDVFHRPADNTFWRVAYRVSTDGEYHGLQEGVYEISRVWPVPVTVTKYVGREP